MALAKATGERVGRFLENIARRWAYVGGAILVAMALVTVFSVIGRALLSIGLGPIRGDFEMVEMGSAIAVFAFLPWCQLKRGHVTVDLVVERLGRRMKTFFGFLGDIALAVISGLILWRLYLGFGEKFPYGSPGFRDALAMGSKPFFPETSYELELPVWIPFGLSTIGAALFFIVSVYTVWRSFHWLLDGGEVKP